MLILNLFSKELFCCKIRFIIHKAIFECRAILWLSLIIFASFEVKFTEPLKHFYLKWIVFKGIVTFLRELISLRHYIIFDAFRRYLIEIGKVRLYKGYIISDEVGIKVKFRWELWCYFNVNHICEIETFPYFWTQEHTYGWSLSIVLNILSEIRIKRYNKVRISRIYIEDYLKCLIICIEAVSRSI